MSTPTPRCASQAIHTLVVEAVDDSARSVPLAFCRVAGEASRAYSVMLPGSRDSGAPVGPHPHELSGSPRPAI